MEKETDVVYCTLNARLQLRSILIHAETRSENERDPFEIPDGVLSELEPLIEQFEEIDRLDRAKNTPTRFGSSIQRSRLRRGRSYSDSAFGAAQSRS